MWVCKYYLISLHEPFDLNMGRLLWPNLYSTGGLVGLFNNLPLPFVDKSHHVFMFDIFTEPPFLVVVLQLVYPRIMLAGCLTSEATALTLQASHGSQA